MFPWFAVAKSLKEIGEHAGSNDNPMIVEMYALCGHGEVKDDEVPWCAAFVGACLSLAGYRNTGSLLARSYLNYGRKIEPPQEGCIAVFSRGDDPAEGHVGFYVGETKNNISILGGNQSDRVSVADRPRSRLLGYFLPKDSDTATSLPATQFLPTIADVDQALVPMHVRTAGLAAAADFGAARNAAMGSAASAVAIGAATMNADEHFLRIHAPIEKWEGGFVDHPADPGGATNMGITLATLSRWRKRPVTKQEVRELTRDEARRIFHAWYFNPVGADRMPPPVALAVYNCAVMSGPDRSVRWLQELVNAQGQAIAVDGEFGPETMGAVGRVEPRALANAHFARHVAFLRSLPTFATFGDGWLNRLREVQAIAATLPTTAPQMTTVSAMTALANPQSRELILAILLAVLKARGEGKTGPALIEAVAKELAAKAPAAVGADGKPLTQVNGALGETIGKALDGRKTGLGIIGLLATGILPILFPDFASNLGVSGGITGGEGGSVWGAIFSALTAWGVLGKAEKWVKGVN